MALSKGPIQVELEGSQLLAEVSACPDLGSPQGWRSASHLAQPIDRVLLGSNVPMGDILCRAHLGQCAEQGQVFGRVEFPQTGGPGPNSADVQAQRVVVWGRGQCEGVVLGGTQAHAGDAHPLPRLVVKVQWALELQVCDTCGEMGGGSVKLEMLRS